MMTATGLDVFDKTLQTTNIWLDELMGEIGPPRHVAWHALGAVLRVLRDRLPIELGAHLGAQLPLLVRGLYYDQFQPARIPERLRTEEEFLSRVEDDLSGTRPVDARQATRAAFAVLNRHVTPELVEKVKDALPEAIRRGSGPHPAKYRLGRVRLRGKCGWTIMQGSAMRTSEPTTGGVRLAINRRR